MYSKKINDFMSKKDSLQNSISTYKEKLNKYQTTINIKREAYKKIDNHPYQHGGQFIQQNLSNNRYDPKPSNGIFEFKSKDPVFKEESECLMDDIYKCNGYAKINNDSYYGLSNPNYYNQSPNICECYTFKENDLTQIYHNRKNDLIILKDEKTNEDIQTINYLGILFDNKLYALEDKNYSNHFNIENNLYQRNEDKTHVILGSEELNDCNPFTGYGVNRINIINVDVSSNCM